MTAQEWSLWKRYYEMEPWDDRRGDLQAAIIASTIANFAGKIMKKGTKPTAPKDFMPVYGKEEDPEVPSDPMAFFSKFK